MAIAFDNASTAAGASVASVQWTHTAAGANTFMALGFVNFNLTSISTAAVNGVAMTQRTWVVNSSGDGSGMFTLTANNTGNVTVSAASVAGTTDSWAFVAVSYTGVQQTGSHGGAATATGAASTVANFSLSATANSVAIAFMGGQSLTTGTVTTPITQTRRGLALGGTTTGRVFIECSEMTATGATSSFSWSISVARSTFKTGLALTATATAGGATFIVGMPLLGVGQ